MYSVEEYSKRLAKQEKEDLDTLSDRTKMHVKIFHTAIKTQSENHLTSCVGFKEGMKVMVRSPVPL